MFKDSRLLFIIKIMKNLAILNQDKTHQLKTMIFNDRTEDVQKVLKSMLVEYIQNIIMDKVLKLYGVRWPVSLQISAADYMLESELFAKKILFICLKILRMSDENILTYFGKCIIDSNKNKEEKIVSP